MLLYDSAISGNCYKVRLLFALLGIEYERREVDVIDRSGRAELLGELNPGLRVPTLVLDDGRPLALQTGYWRPTSATEVEVVLSLASGLVEILFGRLIEDPGGVHVELQSDVIVRTPSAKEVTKERRMYAVRGGQLMYAQDLAAMGEQELHPHLSAALARVD